VSSSRHAMSMFAATALSLAGPPKSPQAIFSTCGLGDSYTRPGRNGAKTGGGHTAGCTGSFSTSECCTITEGSLSFPTWTPWIGIPPCWLRFPPPGSSQSGHQAREPELHRPSLRSGPEPSALVLRLLPMLRGESAPVPQPSPSFIPQSCGRRRGRWG
jgi:hypothetical protein